MDFSKISDILSIYFCPVFCLTLIPDTSQIKFFFIQSQLISIHQDEEKEADFVIYALQHIQNSSHHIYQLGYGVKYDTEGQGPKSSSLLVLGL